MDLNKFIDKAFWALLLSVIALGVNTLQESLKDLNQSVRSLNEKMAVVVQTVSMHDRQIGDIPGIVIQLTELKTSVAVIKQDVSRLERKCEQSPR